MFPQQKQQKQGKDTSTTTTTNTNTEPKTRKPRKKAEKEADMPSGSTRTSGGGEKNDRLLLASAINAMYSKFDAPAMAKSIDDFKAIREEIKTGLLDELQTLKRQKDEAEEDFENMKRNKRIRMDQELAEHGYEAAKKLLQDRQETAISSTELDALRTKLTKLETTHQDEVKQAVETEKQKGAQHLSVEKRTLQLQHEKEVASLTSQVDALNKQLIMAKDELAKGEMRLEAQRELSKSIADACKTPAIVQNMSK